MADLLVDQGFPESVRQAAITDLKLWRWANEEVLSDSEFVELAAREGFQGVIFLGADALYAEPLISAAAAGRIALIATFESDPFLAATALGANLHALSRLIRPGGRLAVYARDVRAL